MERELKTASKDEQYYWNDQAANEILGKEYDYCIAFIHLFRLALTRYRDCYINFSDVYVMIIKALMVAEVEKEDKEK